MQPYFGRSKDIPGFARCPFCGQEEQDIYENITSYLGGGLITTKFVVKCCTCGCSFTTTSIATTRRPNIKDNPDVAQRIAEQWNARDKDLRGGGEVTIAYRRLTAAYNDAIKKHQLFPHDIIHMTAIMAEEAGEAVRAANNAVHEGDSLEPLRRELAQTAAMCIRCLVNLEDRA